MKAEQISIIDEIDQRSKMTERMKLEQIREKLKTEYVDVREIYGNIVDNLPDGLVVIVALTKYETTGQRIAFYRCVIGHHRTVCGPMAHIISKPDEEWAEVPSWQYDNRHNCQWIYPERQMWCKKEPEFDECAWTEGYEK